MNMNMKIGNLSKHFSVCIFSRESDSRLSVVRLFVRPSHYFNQESLRVKSHQSHQESLRVATSKRHALVIFQKKKYFLGLRTILELEVQRGLSFLIFFEMFVGRNLHDIFIPAL